MYFTYALNNEIFIFVISLFFPYRNSATAVSYRARLTKLLEGPSGRLDDLPHNRSIVWNLVYSSLFCFIESCFTHCYMTINRNVLLYNAFLLQVCCNLCYSLFIVYSLFDEIHCYRGWHNSKYIVYVNSWLCLSYILFM